MTSSHQPENKSSTTVQAVKAFAAPIAATILSLGLSAFLITIAFVRIEISIASHFTSTHRTIYTTCTAIGATIVTLFVTSQIRELWLRYAEAKHLPEIHSGDTESIQSEDRIKKLQTYWRTAMRLSQPMEKLRRWNVEISFLMAALITSCIVSSLTPTASMKEVPYDGLTPTNVSGTCVSLRPGGDLAETDNLVSPGAWQLDRDDGQQIYIPHTPTTCPQRSMASGLGSINLVNVDVASYLDNGTAIHRSAMGAPITVYIAQTENGGRRSLLKDYGDSVLESRQCVPIMAQNPVSCRREGTFTVDTNARTINVTSADGSCTGYRIFNPEADGTYDMVTTVKSFCHREQVGKATLMIGGRYSAASRLAVALLDTEWLNEHATPTVTLEDEYTVTCDIDTSDVFRLRMTELSLHLSDPAEAQYTRILKGGDDCNIQNGQDSRGVLLQALSAQAIWRVMEVASDSGWVDVLQNFILISTYGDGNMDEMREPPWAFPQSTNPLEDILGIVSAMAASQFNVNESNLAVEPAQATLKIMRVGDDSGLTAFYALPTLASGILLGVLIYYCWHKKCYSQSKTTDLLNLFHMLNDRRGVTDGNTVV